MATSTEPEGKWGSQDMPGSALAKGTQLRSPGLLSGGMAELGEGSLRLHVRAACRSRSDRAVPASLTHSRPLYLMVTPSPCRESQDLSVPRLRQP